MRSAPDWQDGLVAFVKRECPTCVLVQPALRQLAESTDLVVITQDDPRFPDGFSPVDDTELEMSWRHRIQTVPTLLRFGGGHEVGRAEGWVRS
jgi:thiol-disulfide isomerase/thioredoxin